MANCASELTEREFGRALDEVVGPLCRALAAGQIEHESGGRPRIVVADKVVGGSELGGAALYVAHSPAARPTPRAYGPASWNMDPFDPYSTVVMQQLLASDLLRDLSRALLDNNFRVPTPTEPAAWSVLFLLRHSIGTAKGAILPLLRLAKRESGLISVAPLLLWCERTGPDALPKLGRQSRELVYKRVVKCLNVVRACRGIPASVTPAVVFDASKTARFDARMVRDAILAERLRVERNGRRAPNGSA